MGNSLGIETKEDFLLVPDAAERIETEFGKDGAPLSMIGDDVLLSDTRPGTEFLSKFADAITCSQASRRPEWVSEQVSKLVEKFENGKLREKDHNMKTIANISKLVETEKTLALSEESKERLAKLEKALETIIAEKSVTAAAARKKNKKVTEAAGTGRLRELTVCEKERRRLQKKVDELLLAKKENEERQGQEEEEHDDDDGRLGMTIVPSKLKKGVTVVSVDPRGRLGKTGEIRVGDRIKKVNGISVEGKTMEKVAETFQRTTDANALRITLSRETKVETLKMND